MACLSFKIKLLALFLFFFVSLYPQKRDYNITMVRGDYNEFTFNYAGDISGNDIVFVVKLTKSFSSPRLVQKDNNDSEQLTAVWDDEKNITVITVKIKPEDTQDLNNVNYYYDITSTNPLDAEKHTTIYDGVLILHFDVQTPFDGTQPPTSGTRFYVAGSFVENVNQGDLFSYDVQNGIVPISREEVWDYLNVSDSVALAVDEAMKPFNDYSLTFLYPVITDLLLDRTDREFIIDSIACETLDSAITFSLYYADERYGAGEYIVDHETVTTKKTITSFINATVPEDKYLIMDFTYVQGKINEEFFIKIYYRF